MTKSTLLPPEDLVINEAAGLKVVKKSLDDGAVTPAYGPHRKAIIKLPNDSLATGLADWLED